MADYIGREPFTTAFNTDTFVGNNGTAYTLTYSPGSNQSILVFIDGVYQMPGSGNSYTVSNKTLTFTENVSSLSTIFVLYLGLVSSIGTPGVGTVDFSQLSANVLPPGVMWDYGGIVAPSGWLLCDGAIYTRSLFTGLFTAIGTSFGNGTGSGTDFTVPDFRGRSAVGTGTGLFASSFLPGAVNTGTNQITVASNIHLYTNSDIVTYTTTGTTITGLTPGNPYFIIRVSPTVVSLASTLANAQNGVAITLSGTGTGIHTLTVALSARAVGAVGGAETHAMTAAELLSHNHTQNPHTHTVSDPGTYSGGGAGAIPGSTNTPSGATTATNNPTGGNSSMNLMSPFVVVTKIIKT